MENNNQKLRDAVESLLDFLYNIGIDEETASISHKDPALRELLHTDRTLKVLRKAKAALADPPRNCDVFETETEMRGAFIDWYNEAFDLKCSKYAIETCDLKHDIDGILHEYIEWLFAEAKGGAE